MAERTVSEAASAPLIAAANFVKRCSRAVLARGEDGIGSVAAQRDCLREWFEGRGQILTPGYCRQFHHFGGGAEHEVFFDVKNALAIKSTYPNRFGWCVSSETFPHATPWEYLRRLIYHNWFLGDNIQLVGAIAGEDHIEIITSLLWIYGDR